MPLVMAPTGYTRLTHSQGELSAARSAERADIPYSLSTMSTRSIEEVAAASGGQKWFQVYTWKDRGLVTELVERAAAAGYDALWLTVDTAVLGRRERDVRRGLIIPPEIGPAMILDGILHPAWTFDFITHEPLTFANVVDHAEKGVVIRALSEPHVERHIELGINRIESRPAHLDEVLPELAIVGVAAL